MEKLMSILPRDMPLGKLNERYFAYVKDLIPPLDTMARDRQLFTGRGEATPIESLQEVHPLAICLPWLFHEVFPSISETNLFDIAEAGTLLILALLLQDYYLDGELPHNPGIPLLHQQLHTDALRRFHTLFEAQSEFWKCFDSYMNQYTAALLEEEYKHRGQVRAYPLETMWKIGQGKAALLKTITSALALKAGVETYIAHLERALDALTAALQLGDDIVDWAEDYQNQKYTLPLTQAIPVEQWPTPSLSVEEIGQRLENSVILEILLEQAIEWFHQAMDAVADLNCPRWIEFVEDCLALIQTYQRALVAKKLLKIISKEKVDIK